ncbi:tetratricopeptide repeat protein [Caloramator sp. Dgby_cultured_2]|uniref:tetratricopeptide repeat protein n=1 Tax=Caloramator sp. Dgby_cultured_2 TaxID=3029174 RepID=UPI00237E3981|nr:tetratricopeptide repeat protein [Caloramator sp. Dgby_cultured_2]WDU82997.1 tetratricopeptide repeat protein [Caloramator sp. Dgby_cultured_2]
MQRDFIEERFARLYITIGQYDKAINLLEKYRDKYKDKESKIYFRHIRFGCIS